MGKPQGGTAANVWTYAAQGDVANLQRLLEGEDGKVEADHQNKLGESAAHLAARNGHAQALLVLAKHGANVLLPDQQGRSAVHAAAAAGQLDCLRALAGPLGCRMDGKDAQGQTPLDVAKGDAVRKFLVNWMAEAKTSRRGQVQGTTTGAGPRTTMGGRGPGRAQSGEAKRQQASTPAQAGGVLDYHSSQDVNRQQQLLRGQQQQQAGDDEEQAGRSEGGIACFSGGKSGGFARQASKAPKAAPSTEALRYQPLEHLGSGDAHMPRCTLEEVGFTPQGLSLGMPKRPAWRRFVRNAAELHALEERSFERWQQDLAAKQLPVSFYEPRLDFWRQLWRVLELSDVVIMIVDARNPLLHFSHALTRHVIDDFGATPILVLNKCDLVPAEAVQAWQAFFTRRYPQLKVVAASTRSTAPPQEPEASTLGQTEAAAVLSAAAASAAAAMAGRTGAAASVHRGAAAAILEAVLSCSIWRDDLGQTQVSDLVGTDIDKILDESQRLNTISKRAPAPPASAIRQAADRDAPIRAQTTAKGVVKASATRHTGGPALSAGGSGEDSSSDDAWAVKGTKASRKQAMKQKRIKRLHQGAQKQQNQRSEAAAEATAGKEAGKGQRKVQIPQGDARGQRRQQGRVQLQGQSECDSGDSDEDGFDRKTRISSSVEGEERHSTEVDEGQEEEEEEEEEDEDEGREDELQRQEEEEMRLWEDDAGQPEVPLPQDEASKQVYSRQQPQQQQQQQQQGQDAGSANHRRGRRRRVGMDGAAAPVVVCMVGEPNVGKSSTLNSLLGTHRVAVSSHPGRTKHYQTHYMTDRLMLCDCPGLVFPRAGVSLPMQVLFGSYPIARCRDPYAVVTYLAERVWPRLHTALGLRRSLPDADEACTAGYGLGADRGEVAGRGRDGDREGGSKQVMSAAVGTDTAWEGDNARPPAKRDTDAKIMSPHHGAAVRTVGATGFEDQAAEQTASKGQQAGGKDESSSLGREQDDVTEAWSTEELLTALAHKKNWRSRKGRLDLYRAANWLLRSALAGRPGTCVGFLPPAEAE